MSKLNKLGLAAIRFKEEYSSQEYPSYRKFVKDCLKSNLDRASKKGMTADTITQIIDNSITLEDFTSAIFANENYLKTKEEIERELESLRIDFLKNISDIHIDPDMPVISFDCDVDNEKLVIKQAFIINKEFAMQFFGINEINVITFMAEEKGIAFFTHTRVRKVLIDAINLISKVLEGESAKKVYKISTSACYRDTKDGHYGVDLVVSIDFKAELEISILNIAEVLNEIVSDLTAINEYYSQRMII